MRALFVSVVVVGIFDIISLVVGFFVCKNVYQMRYVYDIAADSLKMFNDQSKTVLMWTYNLIDLKSNACVPMV